MTAVVRLAGVLLVTVLIGALGACAGESASGPPDIVYGRDVCEECHMIISEARYAAAYREEGQDAFAFDDIVDMVTHGTRAGALAGADAWVHDYHSEEWIDARAAWYVAAAVATPMGGGVVAFEAEGDAQTFADEKEGRLLRWDDLVADVEAGMSEATSTIGGSGP